MISKIRHSLARLSEAVEKEPIIFIDGKGKHWLNEVADEFFLKSEVAKDDFVDWLKIGSSHLHNFAYGDVDIHLIRLAEGGSVAFLRRNHNNSGPGNSLLTEKENEVLFHLAKGCSNKQIANLLKISSGTVNSHLDNIYQKLGCSNRLMACLTALQNGFLLPKGKIRPDKRR
jgi:DNA-binding NarL/FixJ family response regulator